jgi:transmembrane sensor
MEDNNELIRDAIAEQAAEWCVKNQAGPLADRERAQFIDWLRSSPLHVEEYLAIATILRDLPVAPAHAAPSWHEVRAAAPQRPLRRSGFLELVGGVGRMRPALAASAASILVAVAVVALWFRGMSTQPVALNYHTDHGQQAAWSLRDGSIIRLNSDSAVTVSLTPSERVVQLTQGQAYFEVAHDKRRPFRVDVNGMHVVAVGTRFDVYQRNSGAVVTVAEGRVAVFSSGDAPNQAAGGLSAGQLLGAGQRILLSARGTAVPESVDLSQSEAWLKRQVIFRKRPLGEVVDEFNRYAKLHLEFTDQAARGIEVSGVFDAYDTESFLAFVATIDGLVVQDVSPGTKRITRSR